MNTYKNHEQNTPEVFVFDWGDTLMKVFPRHHGLMADWPEVAAVPGVSQVLQEMRNNYRLIVATNAAESNAGDVFRALDRVNLAHFFEAIYTTQELQSQKPQPAFFHALQERIGVSADQVVMVGDSYFSDMLGAYRAGWKCLWFNPGRKPCPGLMPVYQGEFVQMLGFTSVLPNINLPALQNCHSILAGQNIPFHLWQHMQAVAAIAYFISVWLRSAGIEIDPVLAQRGGLLHDMAKLQERSRGALEKDHGELSAEILVNLNQPLLAEIAKRHLLSCILDDQRKPQTWEQKVVYLADKLVEGSVLVTISERLGALERRYGIGEVYSQPVFDLQAELCKILQVTPDAWISHIRAALEENYSPI